MSLSTTQDNSDALLQPYAEDELLDQTNRRQNDLKVYDERHLKMISVGINDSELILFCANKYFLEAVNIPSNSLFPIRLKTLLKDKDYHSLYGVIEKMIETKEGYLLTKASVDFLGGNCHLVVTRNFDEKYTVLLSDVSTIVPVDKYALSNVIDSLPFGLMVTDQVGDVCLTNKQFIKDFSTSEDRLGLDKEEVAKIFSRKVASGLGNLAEGEFSEEKVKGQRDFLLEVERNSSRRLYEVAETEFVDESGAYSGLITITNYVSDKLNISSVKELRRKEHQLEESQRLAHVGSWEYNFETNSFLYSKELHKIIGCDLGGACSLKRFFVSCFSKSGRLELINKYIGIFNSNLQIYKNEVVIKSSNRRKITILDTGRIIRDKAGNPLRLYGTVQDITESKQTNEELRSSREKLNSLLKALPDRVLVINADGVFSEYYDNIPGVVSDVQENYRGYLLLDVFKDEIAKLFYDHLLKTLSTREPQCFEYEEGEGLFERWYEVRTSLCNDNEVVFLVRENTQSRKSTQELIKAKKRAEESDQLKSSFLANISHEIRTPLNAMMGFSNILAEENLSEEEKMTYLAIINRNADQLTSLFSDLLDISKIESGQLKIYKEPVNVKSELDKLYHQFLQYQETVSKKKIAFKLSIAEGYESLNVIADETRFIQVISNLLTNAFKFTDKGSVIMGFEKPQNNKVKFFVKDTGKGIPSNEQETIFKRFRQSSTNNVKKHGGTGLGLAISQSLINLMGGRIWVESELGQGSIFWFTLPC